MNNIHHTGIAVESIEKSISFYIKALEMKQITPIVHDPIQKVKVVLLGYGENDKQLPFIELVEPEETPSPIERYLKSNNTVYHYCIEVDNIEESLTLARGEKAIIVQRPVPAVLFNNRKIAWILTPDKHLIEFLEKEK